MEWFFVWKNKKGKKIESSSCPETYLSPPFYWRVRLLTLRFINSCVFLFHRCHYC